MSLGMLLVKIMGALFKIPLTSILGGEGMGYFQSAYNLYNPIYAFSTAGLPIAISRMVSGDSARGRFRDIRRIHKISIPIFILTGSIGTVLMWLSSYTFAKYTNSPNVVYSIFALAPTVLFACLISTYKGYYEGLHNMIPTAVSEVVESAGKVVFGIGLAYLCVEFFMREYCQNGTVLGTFYQTDQMAREAILPFASAAAVLGIAISAFIGYLYMLLKYKIQGDGITKEEIENSQPPRKDKELIKMLLSVSLPIGLGAIIMNLAGVVDGLLIQNRLSFVMDTAPELLLGCYKNLIPQSVIERGTTHIFLWGCFGYMSTITMMVPAISQGISISAMPSVMSSWVKGSKDKIKESIEAIFKLTCLISIPAGLGLSFLSYPIMSLIYGSHSEVYVASRIMVIAGIAVIFTAISTPICTMLQAVGRVDVPVKLLSVGVLIKVILNYFLVKTPQINIQGASVGTLVCYVFVCTVAFWILCRETKIRPNLKDTALKPLISSLFCVVSAYTSQQILSRFINYKISTIFSIAISILFYILALLATKTLKDSDVMLLPKGGKILSLLKRTKLI